MQGTYRVIGIDASPYTAKMRAVMRYRRLPFHWVARMPQFFAETQDLKPVLMPVVQFPDGAYRVDSTPIIRALEDAHGADRSVIPDDAGIAFLNDLIEDFADEWLTKCLFHYRFGSETDSFSGASWVMDDAYADLDDPALTDRVEAFVARQLERRPLVGCTEANAPLFEACFARVLQSMESWVATDRFLFGSRPSSADFGLYGQLRTLSVDPTSAAIMRAQAPRLRHWLGRVDDLSGAEGQWATPELALKRVEPLIELTGRYHLPFLVANARALEEAHTSMRVELDGRDYQQPPFRYQGKCLAELKAAFAALSPLAREQVDPILARTGCLHYLNA